VIVKAAIVPSPPLLARGLTGRAVVLPELREACAVAIGRLLSAPADMVAIVGVAAVTAAWDPGDRLNAAGWGPMLTAPGTPGKPGLPLALGIGAGLLDEAGYTGPRALQSVDEAAPAPECARVGALVAGLAPRVALLVVGDGSARRTPAAPGYFDERAEAFDAAAETAVGDGDLTALARLDAGVAAELMATGRAAWQVLAGAAGPDWRTPGQVLYSGAPFGVSYLVAVLDA
jgi:hypothetical protein